MRVWYRYFFPPTQYTFAFSEKRALIVPGWSVEFVKQNLLSLRKIASPILFFFFKNGSLSFRTGWRHESLPRRKVKKRKKV